MFRLLNPGATPSADGAVERSGATVPRGHAGFKKAASTAKVSTVGSSSTWVSILAAALLWAAPTPASAQVCSDPALLRFVLQNTPAHVCSDLALQRVDVDEDGVCDLDDAFANDPCESVDKDKNGKGDNADMLVKEKQERMISIATRNKGPSCPILSCNKGVATGRCSCDCDAGYEGADCATPSACTAGATNTATTIICDGNTGTAGGNTADGCICIEECARCSDCPNAKHVAIPNSATSIGNWAFRGCSSLASVVIPPDSVTSIGDQAFYECSSLASVAIPDSVITIGMAAFYGCSHLKSVVIPDSVSIGEAAFDECGCNAGLYTPGVTMCNCNNCQRRKLL